MPTPTLSVSVTWTPAESGLTEIASYDILRGVDGAVPIELINCPVLRDFLGGIIGVRNCITVPSIPRDDTSSGSVFDKVTNEDASISYVDTAVQTGHSYCYQVIANPMGNNQSVAQGPPIASAVQCSVTALGAPTLTGTLDPALPGSVLTYSLPVGEFLVVTGWTIFRSVNGGTFAQLAAVSASQLSYEDAAVTHGNTYAYYVMYSVMSVTSPQSPTVTVVP